jgi:hypothetical protein
MSEANKKLDNPARENFAQHYALYGNASAAARLVQISPNTASKWLQDPDVKERIDFIVEQHWLEEAAIRRECGPAYVLTTMRDMIEDEEMENGVRARVVHDLADINGMFASKKEETRNDVAVKVFVVPDSSKLGLHTQDTGATINTTDSAPPIQPQLADEVNEEPAVIPMAQALPVPKKTIVLPPGGMK